MKKSLIFLFLILLSVNVDAHVITNSFVVIETNSYINDKEITFDSILYYDFPSENETFTYEQYFKDRVWVNNNNISCELQSLNHSKEDKRFTYSSSFLCDKEIEKLTIKYAIFTDVYLYINDYLTIHEQDNKYSVLISEKYSEFEYEVQKDSSNLLSNIARFTKIGVEHILFGYDHLLFVIAIILSLLVLKDLIRLVTAFTLAHSLTLILASLEVITLTSKIVEPIIALSIAYMAFSNISNKKFFKELKTKWRVVFIFGLIHGMGFAGALKEIQIPKDYFISSLLSFNLGVELGQLLVILITWPLINLIRKSNYKDKIVYYLSILIGLIGLYWFITRII